MVSLTFNEKLGDAFDDDGNNIHLYLELTPLLVKQSVYGLT